MISRRRLGAITSTLPESRTRPVAMALWPVSIFQLTREAAAHMNGEHPFRSFGVAHDFNDTVQHDKEVVLHFWNEARLFGLSATPKDCDCPCHLVMRRNCSQLTLFGFTCRLHSRSRSLR
jgi:hypothetical protein